MRIFTTFILTMTLLILTSSADARRKGRWKKRNKNKRQNRDPTNLANLIKRCPGNGGSDMTAVFGGMFLSENKLDQLVNETQKALSPQKRSGYTRYVQSNRLSKTIATVESFTPSSSARKMSEPTAQTCCETELKITAPGRVMVDGRSMAVVHMNHSYQYVQEGECVTPGAACRGIGICTQRYKYAFMLLYDPDLVGRVNPPVRYGEVAVKSHCECMNIGRVM